MPLLFMWLKSMDSLLLAAGSRSEASLSEQETESVWGPWSVWLMDGQLVTGTSYRFLHKSGMQNFFLGFFFWGGCFHSFFSPWIFFFIFGAQSWMSLKKVSKPRLKKLLKEDKNLFSVSCLVQHVFTASPPMKRFAFTRYPHFHAVGIESSILRHFAQMVVFLCEISSYSLKENKGASITLLTEKVLEQRPGF